MDIHSKNRSRLIYLPGIDGTGRLLHRQPLLFDRYDVRSIRYPQDRPNTYDELAALGAEQLEPDGGTVLAESFGGAVALTLALSRPELVHRLILVNTFARYPRQPLIKLLASVGKWLPHRPSQSKTRGIRGWFFFPPEIPETDREAWWERTADVPLWAYGMRFGMIARLDLRSRLKEVGIPSIVFVSPNDRVVPPCAGRLLARELPNAKLIEWPAGHAAMIHPKVDVGRMIEGVVV